jgi:hypothetical protein
MPAHFKWPKPKLREIFLIFDTMVLLQLVLLALLALSFAWPLWVFYRAFLKGPLRARRIERIRHDRLLREVMEERSSDPPR